MPRAIVARLPLGSIVTGCRMTGIAREADGTYTLAFATALGSQRVVADQVIFSALPFRLAARFHYARAGFSATPLSASRSRNSDTARTRS